MDSVQELEHYLSKNALDQLVKEMMVSTLQQKPEDPSHYLLKWLILKHAGKESEEVSVASCSVPAPAAAPARTQDPEAADAAAGSTPVQDSMHVAVCHTNKKIQQYLMEKKVPGILLALLKQIVAEQPDKPLSFLALQAHELHKNPPPHLQPAPALTDGL